MQLTTEQIKFLDKVCRCRKYWTLNENGEVDVDGSVSMSGLGLTEIPIKFGEVEGLFSCHDNKLTTLNNLPRDCKGYIYCWGNDLTEYFKNIEVDDLPYEIWERLDFYNLIEEYPFLINIASVLFARSVVELYLNDSPQTKLYLK